MNVTLERSYRSKNGNTTFVYKVNGSKADLAKFKELQGDYYRENEAGVPLWFTTRCIGKTGKLIVTTNDRLVPDMSEFDQAASIAAQYGGNFGNELARAAAQSLIGKKTPSADETSASDDVAKI